MKKSKNILKIIFIIFTVAVISSGISVYATYKYLAKDVIYIKESGEEINVEKALNELYDKSTSDIEYQIFKSDIISTSSKGTFYTKTISIPEGKRKIYIYHSISTSYSHEYPVINSKIIEKQNTQFIKDFLISGVIADGIYFSVIETNGNAGNITITYSCGGLGKHFVSGVAYYK